MALRNRPRLLLGLLGLLGLMAALGHSAPAAAFSLRDHRALAERALALELGAHPSLAACAQSLPRGAVREDLDLITKWGAYSHYYSPRDRVDTGRRGPSDQRVLVLWQRIVDELAAGAPGHPSTRACVQAGRLLHQLQDMGSPPHVLPVAHGLGDGFESFALADLIASATGAALPMAGDVAALHHALADDTYRAVMGAGQGGPWAAHWHAGADAGFGSYGPLGNAFGHSAEPWAGAFADFARDRVEATVAASRSYLRLLAQEIGRSSVE